jgi:tetratricopeptide (TPR) repeat protein
MCAKINEQFDSLVVGGEFNGETNVQIEELVTLLEMASVGTLVICVCNPPSLRERVMDFLSRRLAGFGITIYRVDLNEGDVHVVRRLIEVEKSRKLKSILKKYGRVVLAVMSVENALKSDESRFYQNLNLYRDFFVRSRHPVLFWVNEAVVSEIVVKAPDFWRARTKVVHFRLREEMIVQSIVQLAGMPVYYKDLEDIKRREKIHERLLNSLDPNSQKDKRFYSEIAFGLASLKLAQGNYDGAMELYNKSLKIHEELGDKSGISRTLHQLANIHYLQGNYDRAMELYNKSLKIHEELGDKSGISRTLHQLAMIEQDKGNYDGAMELYNKSLKIHEELGDKSGISAALHQLAMIEQHKGNYDGAMELYNKSLKIHEELGDKSGISRTLHQLANIHYLQGNYDRAMELYNKSLKIHEELGDKSGIAMGLGALGTLLEEKGQTEEAFKHFLKAAFLFHQLSSPYEKKALTGMAKTAQKLNPEKLNKITKEMPQEIKTYLNEQLEQKQ